MSKPNKNKIYLSSFLLIFCMLLFTALYGCGTGPDVAAGSTQPTPTGYNVALTASVSSLQAGQNSILTATVTAGDGKVASGVTVVFSFIAHPSGATIAAVGTGITDAGGKAIAVYTAGATGSSTVEDMIQASATGSTGLVTITRTAGGGGGTDYIDRLGASLSTVSGGQMSVITATVRSALASGEDSNQTITFTIPVNNSGASFIDSGGASVSTITILMQLGWNTFTDIPATYKAGTNVSGTEVEDMVKVTLGNGSTSSIIITRTGSVGGTGVRMTVSATPSSLVAGALSVIVAQVNNADETAAPGLAVTFAFVTNNSGAPTLTVVNGTTDANGTATATYTAGSNAPSLSIQDAVSASVTGSAGAVIITRLPAVGTGNRIKSFTEDPETSLLTPLPATSNFVIMKVKVTTDDLISPVEGETVTFSIIVGTGTITNPTGTVGSPLTVVTDDNGEAYVVFKRPGAGPNDTVVRAQIPGTTNGGDAARMVYW